MARGLLVGFGTMGQTHYLRYAQLGVPILAVVDPDPAAREKAASYGLSACASLDAAPLHEADFVDICTPTYLHHEQLKAAMDRKLASFVEKPVVLTRAEAEELSGTPYSRPIFVGEVEHYNPSLAPFIAYQGQPRAIAISREVNLEFFLRGARPWFLDERLSGGLILDCMIHDLNLLVGKYGKPRIERAQGRAVRYGTIDEATATLVYPDFVATVACSWTATRTSTPIVTSIVCHDRSGSDLHLTCDDYALLDKPKHKDSFLLEIEAFLETLRTGVPPYPLPVYLDGVRLALDIRAFIG